MQKQNEESIRIKDLINKTLKENNLSKGFDEITIQEKWLEVMGPGVQAYTEEVKLIDGVLWVKLSSSVLRQELDYAKDKILKDIAKSTENILIKRIKFT